MFIKCDIEQNYRQQLCQGLRAPSKKCHGAVGLYRRSGKEDQGRPKDFSYSFVVFTNKAKNGFKYRVAGNINRIFSRFLENGRATISFKDPQHDICISKADPHALKRLVHSMKLCYKGEDVPETQSKTFTSGQHILESTKTVMKISSRNDYPMSKSFPTSLIKLSINNCHLVKFDNRILKIDNLRILNLAHNQLQELPESMDCLTNLMELNLSNNKFHTIPYCLFQPVLRSNLRLLDLSFNLLESLPSDICMLDKLANLRLDGNRINALPYNISMLKAVRYLNVAQNNISVLPNGFSSLNIDTLDLSRNPLRGTSAHNAAKVNLQDVHTLFESASRVVINKRIAYSKDTLPETICRYLSLAKKCLCGKVCFQSYALYTSMLDLCQIAHTVTADVLDSGRMSAPIEGYLCSLQCYNRWMHNPNAIWK